MTTNKFVKSTEEFDRRFDEGEDIHDLIDMTKAKIIRHGRKVRITLDIAEQLVQEIDQIRQRSSFFLLAPYYEGLKRPFYLSSLVENFQLRFLNSRNWSPNIS